MAFLINGITGLANGLSQGIRSLAGCLCRRPAPQQQQMEKVPLVAQRTLDSLKSLAQERQAAQEAVSQAEEAEDHVSNHFATRTFERCHQEYEDHLLKFFEIGKRGYGVWTSYYPTADMSQETFNRLTNAGKVDVHYDDEGGVHTGDILQLPSDQELLKAMRTERRL